MFKRIIVALNLVDRGSKLSLTNLAVLVCIIKVALIKDASAVDLSALMLALLNYAHKRTESYKQVKEDKKVDPELLAKVNAISAKQSEVDELLKKADEQNKETQNMLNAQKIGRGLMR